MTKINLEKLINDLEHVKALALENNQTNSVINAIALQAKLLGLDKGEPVATTPKPTKIVIDVQDARKA